MTVQGRKNIIALPLKLVLTEEGSSFFIKNNKKLNRFKLADNVEEYGLAFDNFSASSVQRMVLIDYISKFEISKSEFMSSRSEVMDLSKLIVYGMLYRQYDVAIFSHILGSDVIKRWNRANPGTIIDEKTRFKESFIEGLLKDNQKAISEIKTHILAPLYSYISKSSTLLPDEKNIQLLLSEKFLTNLRPFVWFIMTKFRGAEGYDTMVRSIRLALNEYMEKAKIAEYISLMIMELAINAENTNLRHEAQELYRGSLDLNSALFDPNIRKKLSDELEKKGELVYLSWRIGGKSGSIGTQGRLQITLYNKESNYKESKAIIEERKAADLKKRTLMDFYKEIPDGEANTELGLYYLSYLSEACEKVNVKFESLVTQIKERDLTVIKLVFYF
jgi:hypothetical protein